MKKNLTNQAAITTSVPVKVIVIDDNPDDRALVHRELHREHGKYELSEVSSLEQFTEFLKNSEFDLVITDYQLGWSDGLEILREIKLRRPDVPVIMFTGSGSEEVAVLAMKAGLDDYVLKSSRQFRRLSVAVQKALKMREKRRAVEQAEHRYRQLFETLPVGLFRCTPTGVLLEVNPALLETLGCRRREELLQRNMGDLHLIPAEFGRWREMLERDGAVAHFESQLRHEQKGFRWVKIHAKALRDASTGEIYYEGSVEDITGWKKEDARKEGVIRHLQEAIEKGKRLSGLLPICSCCKKIRDEQGEWNQLEMYIRSRSDAEFTHSFCPECMKELYPEIFVDMPK